MSTETNPNQPKPTETNPSQPKPTQANPNQPETNLSQPAHSQALAGFWEADQAVRACEQEMADLSIELRKRRKHLQNVVKELKRNGIEAPDTGPNIGKPMLPLRFP